MGEMIDLETAKQLRTSSRQERLTRLAEWRPETVTRSEMLALGTREEVARCLESLMANTVGCDPKRLIAHLRALAVTHPMQELSEAEASLKFRIFCEDLRNVPEAVIEAACRSYRRDPKNRFFPTPGQLLALCEPEMRAIGARQRGAVLLLGVLERGRIAVAVEDTPKRDFQNVLDSLPPRWEPPVVPAAQEVVGMDGRVLPERRAELLKLAEALAQRVGRGNA